MNSAYRKNTHLVISRRSDESRSPCIRETQGPRRCRENKDEHRHSRAGGNPATRTRRFSTTTDLQTESADRETLRLSQLAMAAIENLMTLDSRLRGNDEQEARRSDESRSPYIRETLGPRPCVEDIKELVRSRAGGNDGKIYA